MHSKLGGMLHEYVHAWLICHNSVISPKGHAMVYGSGGIVHVVLVQITTQPNKNSENSKIIEVTRIDEIAVILSGGVEVPSHPKALNQGFLCLLPFSTLLPPYLRLNNRSYSPFLRLLSSPAMRSAKGLTREMKLSPHPTIYEYKYHVQPTHLKNDLHRDRLYEIAMKYAYYRTILYVSILACSPPSDVERDQLVHRQPERHRPPQLHLQLHLQLHIHEVKVSTVPSTLIPYYIFISYCADAM